MSLNEIAKIILKANKIGITFHTSPDGDATGSVLGLLNALRSIGKDSYVISREVIQDNLSFLPLADEIDGNTNEPLPNTDLVIVLDCGNYDRVCADLDNYKNLLITIDHHISNEHYGDINYVESDSSATCELVYLLIKELNINLQKNNKESIEICSCIYTGIITDTGSFRHSNVTERTHKIVGELINIGVNNSAIHSNLFDNRSFNKIKLIGEALSSLELFLENKVSYIGLSKEVLGRYNLANVDTSDIISLALSIKGVEVAVVLKEVDDGVKGSLRSKNKVDVRRIAEALGGGGHIKAAGLKLTNNSLEEAKEKIINEIEKEI
ncbi:MAG: bifunctional oligoribonuclease/PAP phosphatase NrnA [Clostridiales bacterium]|nr:bifunctional oligoribonuclease/PAP phosphatase NrnA [Clostridiales bacterium]